MLVLKRKPNESIIISDSITVTVLSVKGNQVILGCNAPKNVVIHRNEVFERIQKKDKNQSRSYMSC